MKTKIDSKTQLINTAYRLFLNKSYNSTSTSLICEEASINKGTFYHFFHSKADLLIACIKLHGENITTDIKALENLRLSGNEKLQKLLALLTQRIKEKFDEEGKVSGCFLGNITLELSTIDNKIRNEVINEATKIQQAMASIIDQYARENNLAIDVKNAAEQVYSYIQGLVLMAKLHNSPYKLKEIEKVIPQLIESFSLESCDV
ncbi:TetR/AcrR family transcriptional regulator [Sessilibacter corallicola]|uniref:TetR/AcrR family transcriptional regulator n=1 Tax=Sessilibacter corallicola TaxID=2904075 RepID=A0ABQ0A6S0_9GAMM|nr:TetR/AcrR family transcriptional regulator [Sessilibacter corallicola]MCE2028606.1 TetR/AcrR family transcriptional regulator [Sessilibacter corallicola]